MKKDQKTYGIYLNAGAGKDLLLLLSVSPLEFKLQEGRVILSVLFSLEYSKGPKIVLGT